MRKADIYIQKNLAGLLEEISKNHYRFSYLNHYQGPPVSLTMPTEKRVYDFDKFPPFFEGLLPEGHMLEFLLRHCKIDRKDYFGQLLKVGEDVVGAVSIRECR